MTCPRSKLVEHALDRLPLLSNRESQHTTATPFDVAKLKTLPRVDIVYAHAGADGLLVDAVRQNGSDGLVLVGFGGGSYPSAVLDAGARAVAEGIAVVLASRATAGRVIMTPQKEELGFIVCDDLLPQRPASC